MVVVGDSELLLTFTQSEQPCAYGVEYTVLMKSSPSESQYTQPLPAFIQFDPIAKSFTVEQTAEAQIGLYEIKLTAALQDTDQTEAEETFTIDVIDQCEPASFSLSSVANQVILVPDDDTGEAPKVIKI